MATPLRVLAIAPNPSEMPLPGIEQEIKILRQVLESAPIRLEVMNSPTKNSVQQALRKYLPHIIHFMGHGTVHNGMGYLMLLDDEGRPDFVNADKLGVMLQDSGILLAVLNGCATGSSEIKDLGRGVAQRLVRQGVPAAVATTRVILDDAALKFAAAFYQAFSDGYAVEASLVESRKALSISGFDWSAYVMYASLGFPLQEIRVTGRRTPGLD
jgi:CHAT domain-containing protein